MTKSGRSVEFIYRASLQSLNLFLKPGYVKPKRQDKLKPNAFACFFICPSANRPRDSHELLLYSGHLNSRNVTWACLPSSIPASTENVHYVSV